MLLQFLVWDFWGKKTYLIVSSNEHILLYHIVSVSSDEYRYVQNCTDVFNHIWIFEHLGHPRIPRVPFANSLRYEGSKTWLWISRWPPTDNQLSKASRVIAFLFSTVFYQVVLYRVPCLDLHEPLHAAPTCDTMLLQLTTNHTPWRQAKSFDGKDSSVMCSKIESSIVTQ